MPRTRRLVTLSFQGAIHVDRIREQVGTPVAIRQFGIVAAQKAAGRPNMFARLAAGLPTTGLLGYHRCDNWRH